MDCAENSFPSNSINHDSESASYGAAIFAESKHFTVSGGTFTSTANIHPGAPSVPTDFRIIPVGDIDLQHEICMQNYSNIVDRQRSRRNVRKVYSAKVDGRRSSVTVAVYQGDGAEQEWRQDIEKYRTVRHPNIIQVCGTASSGNIHATIFHDNLIPLEHFLDLHQNSHFATVYIYAYLALEFTAVVDYFRCTLHWPTVVRSAIYLSSLREYLQYQGSCTLFIRPSTGRLCADLIPNNVYYLNVDPWLQQKFLLLGLEPLGAPNIEAAVMNFLTLNQYYQVCHWQLSRYRSTSNASTSKPGNLGAVYSTTSHSDWVDIASMPEWDPDVRLSDFSYFSCVNGKKQAMENGWTRFTLANAINRKSHFRWISATLGSAALVGPWLSQANHLFNRLGISSDFENYVVVDEISFLLTLFPTIVPPPEGFLFLCPPEDFQTGDPSLLKWPDCPAYWSFDPSGGEQLSEDEAANLGFPSIKLSTELWGKSWDAEVYAGLRQFHQAKGFDPDSQDLARHLGYPLYELSSKLPAPFAYKDSYNEADAMDEECECTLESLSNAQRDTSLDPNSQHSKLDEGISVSNPFNCVRNLFADLIPGVQDTESEGMEFSPILM